MRQSKCRVGTVGQIEPPLPGGVAFRRAQFGPKPRQRANCLSVSDLLGLGL